MKQSAVKDWCDFAKRGAISLYQSWYNAVKKTAWTYRCQQWSCKIGKRAKPVKNIIVQKKCWKYVATKARNRFNNNLAATLTWAKWGNRIANCITLRKRETDGSAKSNRQKAGTAS